MILSTSLILFIGLIVSYIFNKIKLPALIGYLLIGILIGPYGLNLINDSLINNSHIFRGLALVIILIRAGLSLDLLAFKKMGRPVILLSFLPAILEVLIVGLLGPVIFDIPYLDAFLLGAVIASVSPAVIIPRMLTMVDEEHGTKKLIPQTIITGSSLDDIIVISIFTILLTIKTKGAIDTIEILTIPLEILLGISLGIMLGYTLSYLVEKFKINYRVAGLIIIVISTNLYFFQTYIFVNGLLAILTFAIIFSFKKKDVLSMEVAYKKVWFIAEILLFTLVGIGLDLNNFFSNITKSLLIIVIALAFRVLGTYLSLIKSNFNNKEKLFIIFSYLPKATVQAAIGSLALEAGLLSGNLILSVSIAVILVTAPLGAILIDSTKNILITKKQ